MNFNTARQNMLLNQVRTWDFVSPNIIKLMQQLQREEFVPVEHRKLAFSDLEIPLDHQEYMMKPIVEGRVLQALALKGDEKVLEIGTGSGYFTALLGLSADAVTSIDIYQDFCDAAIEKLQEAQIKNVTCECADVYHLNSTYKYDYIVATGSFPEVPTFLFDNIKQNGKIFALIGEDPVMSACLIHKDENNDPVVETLFETSVKAFKSSDEKTIFEL